MGCPSHLETEPKIPPAEGREAIIERREALGRRIVELEQATPDPLAPPEEHARYLNAVTQNEEETAALKEDAIQLAQEGSIDKKQ